MDQRVLRWFGHVEGMNKFRIARKVLMMEVSGGEYEVEIGYVCWIGEGGLEQQRDDIGGCATIPEGYEGVENPGAYIDD